MAFLIVWDLYLYYVGKWDLFLFVSRVILANLDVPRHIAAKNIEQDTSPEGEYLLPTIESMGQMAVDLSEQKILWHKMTGLGKRNSTQTWKANDPVLRVSRAVIPYILIVFALWLLSFPHVPNMTWEYWIVPNSFDRIPRLIGGKDKGIRIIGAMLMAFYLPLSPSSSTSISSSTNRILSSPRNRDLQPLFTNCFSQYLGRI